MQSSVLNSQFSAWNNKPALRYLYHNWHKNVISWLINGESIEIGCGIGQLKEILPHIKTIDVAYSKWTDIVGDAQELPLKSESAANLILFDVLHHLPKPILFFKEAQRILKSKGRVVIVEPYISFFSGLIYKKFHPEPVNIDCDPLSENSPLSTEKPFDSNQAIATVLFFKQVENWKKTFPYLRLIHRCRFAQLAYPATGGFGSPQIMPDGLIRLLFRLEKHLSPISKFLAFRTLVVIEKK